MTSRVVVDSNVIFLKKLHNSIREYACPIPYTIPYTQDSFAIT
jgi:hypothetical protein